MGERLTQEWTKTAEEAFGATGARGSIGEQFVFNAIRSWGWFAELFEDDYQAQVTGIDIAFQNPSWARPYTADIKANMDESGSFYVDTDMNGWLFNANKISDRIWHCNPRTGWMAWYGRREMQEYIYSLNKLNTALCKITPRNRIDFITRRKVNI